MKKGKAEGEVWSAAPSRDTPPHRPIASELDFKESGPRGGRPVFIMSKKWMGIANTRHIVIPLKHSSKRPPFSILCEKCSHDNWKAGWLIACQPFGFADNVLHSFRFDLSPFLDEARTELDSYLCAPGDKYHAGQLIQVRFLQPTWCVVASGAKSPLGMISVFRCLEPYEPRDELNPEIYILARENVVAKDIRLIPEKLRVALKLVRTIHSSRVITKFGRIRDNGKAMLEKFGRTLMAQCPEENYGIS